MSAPREKRESMDPLEDIVDRVGEYGGPPMTFHVPENASIRLSDHHGGHLLSGATITAWGTE